MKTAPKLPSIQFYPGDWRKDPGVQALTFHDRGVWFEILLLMHESSERGKLLLNSVPMPEEALARLLGLDKQILTTTLTTLLTYGVVGRDQETGALISRRMIRDEEIRKTRTEAGKRGGNPVLLKQIPTAQDKQKTTPSSSSSSSSSDINTESESCDSPARSDSANKPKRNGSTPKPSNKPTSWQRERFLEFWALYPKTVKKSAAETAYWKAVSDRDESKAEEILNAVRAQLSESKSPLRADPPSYIPHAASWLNQCRWEDDYMPKPVAGEVDIQKRGFSAQEILSGAF